MVDGVERPDVDERSFDLAMHFLAEHKASEDDAWSLAGEIQQAVEDWFADREDLMGAAVDRHEFNADVNELSECQHCGWPKDHPRHAVVVENQCPGTIEGNHVPTPGSNICALCRQRIGAGSVTGVTERG